MDKPIKSYTDLIVWQKAMDLVTEVHSASAKFPSTELYGLTAQIRRATYSIPSNISEGHGRLSRRDYRYFLGHARGSLFEVQTQLHIAERLRYLEPTDVKSLLNLSHEIRRMLNAMIRALAVPSRSSSDDQESDPSEPLT